MTALRNRRIVLASRPQGNPVPDNFRLEIVDVPELQVGQMLLRARFLSLDPYMRGRMSDAPSYAPPVALGAVMVGGTVCEVVESRHPDYAEGEIVLAYTGWQTYAISDGAGLLRLGDLPHPSLALGVLGMPGFTAYMGLMDIGVPKAGETVVVAAASGAVGAVVGQLATAAFADRYMYLSSAGFAMLLAALFNRLLFRRVWWPGRRPRLVVYISLALCAALLLAYSAASF